MNANSTEFCLKAMPKAVNTHATWALLAGGKCTCQAEGKTKFYNQLKPEIISILFKKKTVWQNVYLERAGRSILQNAPNHLSDKPSQRLYHSPNTQQ